MTEKLRQIHYMGGYEGTKNKLKTYILANTIFFNLGKGEDFELVKIISTEQLKEINDETVVLYNVKQTDYNEKEVDDFKLIGEHNDINFVSITL